MLPTSAPESKPNAGGSSIFATGPVELVFTLAILLIFLAGIIRCIAPRSEHRPLSRHCIDSAFHQARLTRRVLQLSATRWCALNSGLIESLQG
jgi:hypothetical protein